jgi:DNA-directed RNA polymerase specialized sigma24 family protein
MDVPEWTREAAIPKERAVHAIASNAVQTFEAFFESERVRLYRALFAVTGSRSEAEDIAQDAFLKVWERWDRVRRMDEPAGYLHRTAMNVFRDRRRRLILTAKRAVHLAPPPDDTRRSRHDRSLRQCCDRSHRGSVPRSC